uniref:DUF4402 domain-containing protein n=1 Tax=Thermosporothrix sp. COM3 TaxID=2490863 RepID=A0A455SPG8_9CHLR|nr:hypothetical protein KTC_35830 [Thermosporothrix sp. COM3]
MRVIFLFPLLFFLASCTPQTNATLTPTATVTLQMLQQRPLHLPSLASGTSCPVTPSQRVDLRFGAAQGKGPLYMIIDPATGATGGQDEHLLKTLVLVAPSYQGPILLRGQQLDGHHEVRFGQEPASSKLALASTIKGRDDSNWLNYATYTRVRAPGCYGIQLDGASFHYQIIFKAV